MANTNDGIKVVSGLINIVFSIPGKRRPEYGGLQNRPPHRSDRIPGAPQRSIMVSASNEGRIVYQNIVLALLEVAGTGCSTSQCSTILPSASKRKMSTPAVS